MEKQLDSISLWTIFEYLPISSYLSILLTCKEWNNKLINLNKFKENKIFFTTLISEITKIKSTYFYDCQNKLQNLVCNKYKNNITAIFYLLSKLVDYKTFIFEKCNFRNNKLIILNSFINENGECILRLISDKTLQRDKEILLNAYKHNNEYGRRRFVNSCIPTEYYLDYNFCYSMLQICKAKTDIHLIQLIKNLESIKDYFKNIKIILNTLININKEILNEEFISILILEGNITKQQLKYYFEMNNELLNKINNTKLIYEFIKKRNFLITTFYKKLCKEDLIKIFSENPFTFKIVMNYDNNIVKDFADLIIEKNVKAFRVLPRNYRSMKLNREFVCNIIKKDCEMVKYVCDLNLFDFEELCDKNESLKVFKDKILFKKD